MTTDTTPFYTMVDPEKAKHDAIIGRKNALSVKYLYYQHYLRKLTLAARSCFRWVGLGDEITSRIVEKTLLEKGFGVFYTQQAGEIADWGYGETLDAPRHVFRQATLGGGQLDGNFQPTTASTIQPSGSGRRIEFHGAIDTWTGVPIWDNDAHDSYTRDTVSLHAYRLADLAATIDINQRNTRTPRLIVGDEDLKKTLSDINQMLDDGTGAIMWNSKVGSLGDHIQVLDLGTDPRGLESLHTLFTSLEGEAYTSIGVKAQDTTKMAQQSIAEVTATESMVDGVRLARFDARRWAADAFNKRYSASVHVVDTGTGDSNG